MQDGQLDFCTPCKSRTSSPNILDLEDLIVALDVLLKRLASICFWNVFILQEQDRTSWILCRRSLGSILLTSKRLWVFVSSLNQGKEGLQEFCSSFCKLQIYISDRLQNYIFHEIRIDNPQGEVSR